MTVSLKFKRQYCIESCTCDVRNGTSRDLAKNTGEGIHIIRSCQQSRKTHSRWRKKGVLFVRRHNGPLSVSTSATDEGFESKSTEGRHPAVRGSFQVHRRGSGRRTPPASPIYYYPKSLMVNCNSPLSLGQLIGEG